MKKILVFWLFVTLSSYAFGQASRAVPNAGTTGTTLNSTAAINSSYQAVIATTSNTGVPVYVVVAAAGTTGSAILAFGGQALCTFDANNASGAGGYYVIASVTTGGDCHAQSAAPSNGVWVIGYLDSAATTSGATALVNIVSGFYNAATGSVTSIATTSPITGGTITGTGTIACATCVTSAASLTAHAPVVGEGSQTSATIASAGTNGQVLASQGTSTDPHYIDVPDFHVIPAANCNNTTAGAGWSIGASGTVTCRAGTNNLGGYVAITDTSSSFAQFTIAIPEDWDTATNPYIRFQIASTDTTSGHTIIPAIQVSCTGTSGTTTDDVTFNAAHSLSTVTLNTTNHQFWSTSNVQMNSTDVTGCSAGSMMIVSVQRATDTATAAEFYSATVTFPRLIAVQAN